MNKWVLVRETGWTLTYIENELDASEIPRGLEIYDAIDRGNAWLRQREAHNARR